ncbi:MAG: hypothetical protein EOS58_02900 [Mesorhizobium sp.]|uniref:hypothetical protein n=1 Tax=unclassified Mesorhizobium TaxID=325217 RepID=UPI000F75668A|nr:MULTISPECIES: hypothetical protein [unclassified Mesorhizobium]RVD69756.1 hypothetical protein EN751_24340 [Mesorhizobium sp. M4A.F.Ca.ET.029.04.2.1]AZO51136.1 hypothetical protein EJ073_27995 [Mesorhizobium sp. M4B.F.Ca.ET.058.02.1.1]RUX49333.1 hypothetical protein EOA33_12830 [Mesorhizobium sp. M4A.F.Ca.ET.050.02.1.1]RVC41115.1 hypothetical protein EN781_27285 [Mesorhizobium sp. M4A.F.Ca.ET.090.04.2.1]RVC79439.1 hypothetical protein EN745_15985 [Mesorhizobium sp. M4A.F.Ca.ET.022.05.2.1]
MKIIERFQISGRGVVVVGDLQTDFRMGQKLNAIVMRPDGSKTSTAAEKEYALRRIDDVAHEFEVFVLRHVDLADVPEGSTLDLTLIPSR